MEDSDTERRWCDNIQSKSIHFLLLWKPTCSTSQGNGPVGFEQFTGWWLMMCTMSSALRNKKSKQSASDKAYSKL